MQKLHNDKSTIYASYLGYITQAIINNLAPLLFVTIQKEFQISLELIGLLVSINFGIQIFIDFISAKFIAKLGYRPCIVAAHIICTFGLLALGILPYCLPNAYVGLVLATALNAVGGGLIEVLISPIVEAVPGEGKERMMSLLHSFYCWGHVAVVLLSTLYFRTIGITHWFALPMVWAVIPLANAVLFTMVPIYTIEETNLDRESGELKETIGLKKLFCNKIFLWLFLLMICSGVSEQAMSQWASYFAEAGLKISKTMGDLLGPCAFAILMGTSRALYGALGEKLKLERFMIFSSILCIISYLLAIFSPIPVISLLGCAICGFSVGIMWPGTFSLSAKYLRQGGTAMFAILALAGDVGCASGPAIVGTISNAIQAGAGQWSKFINWLYGIIPGDDVTQFGIKTGLLPNIIFPILIAVGILALGRIKKEKKKD